jgi:hypothetical protein
MTEGRTIKTSNELTAIPQAEAVRGAHRVLTCWVHSTALPTDLPKLRAMLDAHMFGRDRRAQRDDAVRVAWQIDSLRKSGAS